MNPQEVLENCLFQAIQIIDSKKEKICSERVRANIDILINKIDKNKSLVSALVSSLVKKIIDPNQDIRLHRTDFQGGYSARSLDASVTAPFFKKHFPKYANKESAFLTLALREKIKWTKKAGKNLKIRDKEAKKSFLEIFDAVENGKANPKECLVFIFEKLYLLSLQQKMIFDETIESAVFSGVISINGVLNMLERHFEMKSSSRLPVIAIYSVYQNIFSQVKRYEKKTLKPLNVHTSSDRRGYGDIEIWNENATPFEIIEVKHQIPIDRNLIYDVVKKSEGTTIERYYVLTTSKNNFVSAEEEEHIDKLVLKVKKETGLEIIPNGIYQSLKYYLRFVEDYKEFLRTYAEQLILDSKNSTEVSEFHVAEWQKILKERKID